MAGLPSSLPPPVLDPSQRGRSGQRGWQRPEPPLPPRERPGPVSTFHVGPELVGELAVTRADLLPVGTGAWGQQDCVPSRMASVPVPPPLWNPCACPIRKTRKGNLYVTSMREEHRVGEDHGIEKHSQKIIFHLNFLSLTKLPGLVPKGGVKTERTARRDQCNLRHKQTSLFTVLQAKLLALLPPTPI